MTIKNRIKLFFRGHGTYVEESNVVSSVAGTIERVNKLISVRPLRSRWVHPCEHPYGKDGLVSC